MKLRALMAATAAALIAVSAATATPPPGKGKPTGQSCKANVSVILTGTLAADGSAGATSISVTVTGGNKFGKLYKSATAVSIGVTATTKFVKGTDGAKAKVESLKSGDKVNVQAKACKAGLSATPLPALTATRVTVRGADSGSGS